MKNEAYRIQRIRETAKRGEDCPTAKLSRAEVEEIKSLIRQRTLMSDWIMKQTQEGKDVSYQKDYLRKNLTYKAIGSQYNISDKNIWSIANGQSWSHV